MPVYNCGPYLDEAIRSIRAQTFTDFEFIIVNDGSTDNSLETIQRHAAEDPRIIAWSRPNGGYATALVEMASVARGRILARMDGDDVAMADRFKNQVDLLRACGDVVAVGAQCWRIDVSGARLGSMPAPLAHEAIDAVNIRMGGGGIAHPSAMLRRSAFDRIGGYRPQFEPAEDGDLWLRLAEIGRLANLENVGLLYRIHSGQTSRRVLERLISVERAVREAAIRRRVPYRAERAMHHRNVAWAARDEHRWGLMLYHASRHLALRSNARRAHSQFMSSSPPPCSTCARSHPPRVPDRA